jgi:hypothetical protein
MMDHLSQLTPKQHIVLEIRKARDMYQQHLADYLRMREDQEMDHMRDQLTDMIYDCLTIIENYRIAINENS